MVCHWGRTVPVFENTASLSTESSLSDQLSAGVLAPLSPAGSTVCSARHRRGFSGGGVHHREEGGSAGGDRVRRSAATLDARQALLVDLPSYGAHWAPFTRVLAGRLGWRLAADLELVRTRGIRLFN